MIRLKDGETFVAKRNKENAHRLLEAARAAGLGPEVVRAQSDGYIVPTSILESEKAPTAKPPAKKKKAAASKASAPSIKE